MPRKKKSIESKKPDWEAVKTEYITTDISQRKLAEKVGVSYGTLRGRCEREQWVKSKEEYQRKLLADVTQELEKKQIKNLVTEVQASDEISKIILKSLERQEEYKYAGKLDTKRLNEAVNALYKCAGIKKLALLLSALSEKSSKIKIVFDEELEELSE